MKPVDQTIVDDKRGDCLRACVCSILELPIEEVPNFSECGFFDGLDKWLAERGMRFIRFSFIPRDDDTLTHKNLWFDFPKESMLIWGDSPRFNSEGRRRQHAVVGKAAGYGVEITHDPHASRDGLHNIYGFGWIVPTNCEAKA